MQRLVHLSLALATVRGAIEADRVTELPGFDGELPSAHYSGYLPVGATSGAGLGQLHYWLIESEGAEPTADPLVLWLNGGPGSSSLIGLLNENGQVKVDGDSLRATKSGAPPTVFYNPYSWSSKANVLYLEQPKGVGYSYCESSAADGAPGASASCTNTDANVGPDVHDFLVAFYAAYPEYADRDFWITGESYGGTYIPLIMDEIDRQGVLTNLKGAAIGNGCTSGSCFSDMSEEYIDFEVYSGHAMISPALQTEIRAVCGDFSYGSPSLACSALLTKMRAQASQYNVYNLYDTCGSMSSPSALGALDGAALRAAQRAGGAGRHIGWRESLTPHPPIAQRGAEALAAEEEGGLGAAPWNGSSYPCGNDAALDAFLGNDDVMAALHVTNARSGQRYTSTQGDLQPLYHSLAQKYRLVIFSGDVDLCVPYPFSEHWTAALNFSVARDWHAWTSNALATDESGGGGEVVAGYAVEYETPGADWPFYFVTVKGAGHMVPQYKPAFALTFFEKLLAFDF